MTGQLDKPKEIAALSATVMSVNPASGRLCDELRPGLRRLEHRKHVVFYRQERAGILVSRILHQRMLPDRHIDDDQGDEP